MTRLKMRFFVYSISMRAKTMMNNDVDFAMALGNQDGARVPRLKPGVSQLGPRIIFIDSLGILKKLLTVIQCILFVVETLTKASEMATVKQIMLFANPSQVCMLEIIGILHSETKQPVQGAMTKQDCGYQDANRT